VTLLDLPAGDLLGWMASAVDHARRRAPIWQPLIGRYAAYPEGLPETGPGR